MARPSDRHESAPRPSRRGWSPLQYLVRYGETLKVTLHTAYNTGDRGGPDIAPNREMERQARSPPLCALRRKEKGQHLMYCTAAERHSGEASSPPFPLCPAMGARGLFMLQGDREDVLEERIHEDVGLWTQTLLARDVLDGWSGLRPYAVMFAYVTDNLLQDVMRPFSGHRCTVDADCGTSGENPCRNMAHS